MRGKDDSNLMYAKTNRITPAYAGKSLSQFYDMIQKRDHPRLCGEKPVTVLIDFVLVGSPPPMRGKATPQPFQLISSRITPAYAGKSS